MTSPLNSPLRIVLADDDIDDCFIFEEIIKEITLAIDLTIVKDGVDLMELLSSSPEIPHVIFLDLIMPGKTGFECLSDIHADSKFSNLPIVIFSSPYDPAIADRIYKKGAYYYMIKTSNFAKLKKVIHQVLTQISHKKYAKPHKEEFVLIR